MLWDRESPHGLLTGNRSKLASEATNRVPGAALARSQPTQGPAPEPALVMYCQCCHVLMCESLRRERHIAADWPRARCFISKF